MWFSKNVFFLQKYKSVMWTSYVQVCFCFFFFKSPSCVYVFKLSCFSLLLPLFFPEKFFDVCLPAQSEQRRRAIGSCPTFFCFFLKFHPNTTSDRKITLKTSEHTHTHTRTHARTRTSVLTRRAKVWPTGSKHLRRCGQCTGNKYSHSEKSQRVQACPHTLLIWMCLHEWLLMRSTTGPPDFYVPGSARR